MVYSSQGINMTEELSGSCLCGTIRYQTTGSPDRFYHCHCQRCRKATGTGHASNLLFKPDSFDWTAGEDQLTKYKFPDAKRFGTCFCKNCGSNMPRVAPDQSFVVLPAGSLDTSPTIKPMARIFWDSRADWSCEDTVTQHSTYPPTS